jgi:hypothetical protein
MSFSLNLNLLNPNLTSKMGHSCNILLCNHTYWISWLGKKCKIENISLDIKKVLFPVLLMPIGLKVRIWRQWPWRMQVFQDANVCPLIFIVWIFLFHTETAISTTSKASTLHPIPLCPFKLQVTTG